MLFMVIGRFRNQDAEAVYRRFRDRGRMMPDGLAFVGNRVKVDLGRCFQLRECAECGAACPHDAGMFRGAPALRTGRRCSPRSPARSRPRCS